MVLFFYVINHKKEKAVTVEVAALSEVAEAELKTLNTISL